MSVQPPQRPPQPTHPVILLIVGTLMVTAALFVGIAVLEPVGTQVQESVPSNYDTDITNIQTAVLQYSVVIVLFVIMMWSMFWYLRRERQTRRI